jgi:hypothetical protein
MEVERASAFWGKKNLHEEINTESYFDEYLGFND